ncbi:MAG: 50S ribosomal protein L10 [archaeon]
MSKTKVQKNDEITKYKESIANAKAIYFVKPSKVTANDSTKLKLLLSKSKAKFNVVKNTLFTKAMNETLPEVKLGDTLFVKGEHAVIFANDDITESAKILNTFAKESKKLEILSGIYGKKMINKDSVLEIATLPTYEVMLSKTLATFMAPVSSFVRVNNSIIQNFVFALKAISEKK